MDANIDQIMAEETPLTSGQKTKIYVASILLAPLGLIWFFKYFKSKDAERRKIAYRVLFITIVLVGALVIVNVALVESVTNYLNMYKQSLGLEGLSY